MSASPSCARRRAPQSNGRRKTQPRKLNGSRQRSNRQKQQQQQQEEQKLCAVSSNEGVNVNACGQARRRLSQETHLPPPRGFASNATAFLCTWLRVFMAAHANNSQVKARSVLATRQ
jgi:hypothetical protein